MADEEIIDIKVVVDDKQLDELAKSRKGREIGRKIGKDISDGIKEELRDVAATERHIKDALQVKNVGNVTTGGTKRAEQSRAQSAQRAAAAVRHVRELEREQKVLDEENEVLDDVQKSADQVDKNLKQYADKQKKQSDYGFYVKGQFVKKDPAKVRTNLKKLERASDIIGNEGKYTTIVKAITGQMGKQNLTPNREYGRNLRKKDDIPEGTITSKLPARGEKDLQTWFDEIRETRRFWFTSQVTGLFKRGEVDQAALKKLSKEETSKLTNANVPRLPGTSAELKTAMDKLFNDPERVKFTNWLLGQAQKHPIKALNALAKQPGFRELMSQRKINEYATGIFGKKQPDTITGPRIGAAIGRDVPGSNAPEGISLGVAGYEEKAPRDISLDKFKKIQEKIDQGRQRVATEDEIKKMIQSDQRVAGPREIDLTSKQRPMDLNYITVRKYAKILAAVRADRQKEAIKSIMKAQDMAGMEADMAKEINEQMEREATKEDLSKEDISYDAELKKYKESGKLAADKAAANLPKKKKSANLEHMIGVGVAKAKSDMERIQAKIQNPDASYREMPGYPQAEEAPEFLDAKMNAAMGGARTMSMAPAGHSVPAFKSDVTSVAAQSAMKASLDQLGKNLKPIVNAVQQTATQGNKFMGEPSPNAPGSVGYRKFIDGNVYLTEESANLAIKEQIQKAINRQYENIAKMTGSSIPDAMNFHAKLKQLLGPAQKIGNFLKEMSHAVDKSPEALEAVAREKFQRYLRGKPAEKAAMEGKPPITEPTLQQKMFGQDYKIKLSFRDYDEFKSVMDDLQKLPGWIKTSSKEYERYGALGTDVLHTMELTGHLKGGPDIGTNIEAIRKKTEAAATGPSAIPERSQLEIGDKRLSLQQKLELAAQRLDKLNWKLVRGQMALLGVAFSMMGAIKMVSKAWQTVTTSLSSLEDIFKNIGMAIAFGPSVAQGFLRNMLGSSTKIVDSWKKFQGYQSTLNSMLAYFAFRLMQDTRVIFAIDRLVEKIIGMLQDTAFMDRIFGLIANVIDALPGVVDAVASVAMWLMGIMELPGMKDVLKWMVAFGLISQFLMTPLAVLGAAIQFIGWAVGGLATALGFDFAGAWAKIFAKGWLVTAFATLKATLIQGIAELSGLGALAPGTLIASIAAGLLIGLVAVRLMIETGAMKLISGFGRWLETNPFGGMFMSILKVLLMPFGLLGTLIVDIVTLQFASIPSDLANVVAQTISVLLGLLTTALGAIPILGPLMVQALAPMIKFNEGVLKNTKTGTRKAAGGPVRSGEAYIVGEKGPEVFVPRGTGNIIPNHMTGYADGSLGNWTPGGGYPTIAPGSIPGVDNATLQAYNDSINKATDNVKTETQNTDKQTTIVNKFDAAVEKIATVITRIVGTQKMTWDAGTGTWQEKGKTNPNVPAGGISAETHAAAREKFFGAKTQTEINSFASNYIGRYAELTQPVVQATQKVYGAITTGYTATENALRQGMIASMTEDYKRGRYPELAGGGFVKSTGAAIVHKGERVLSEDETNSQNVNITNYVTATVNNKTDEKYLLEILGRKYYSGAY